MWCLNVVALRRYEVAGWLRKMVGVVAGKDLPAEPSEEHFRIGLRSGIILCNVLNKIQPGAVPKYKFREMHCRCKQALIISPSRVSSLLEKTIMGGKSRKRNSFSIFSIFRSTQHRNKVRIDRKASDFIAKFHAARMSESEQQRPNAPKRSS
ncbi:hypothetical protein Droror1_Dr00024886 [Drosera rotundifolia]